MIPEVVALYRLSHRHPFGAAFHIAGVVDNSLELPDCFHEAHNHLVIEFLRRDTPTAESGEMDCWRIRSFVVFVRNR